MTHTSSMKIYFKWPKYNYKDKGVKFLPAASKLQYKKLVYDHAGIFTMYFFRRFELSASQLSIKQHQ